MCASVAESCAFSLGGLSPTITFQWLYPSLMAVQLTFDFDVQLLHSIFQKNPGAMAIVLVQDSYTLALEFVSYSDFRRCKVNRERTLVLCKEALVT